MAKSALDIYNEAIAPHRAARDAAKAVAEAAKREACDAAHAEFMEKVAPFRAVRDAAVGAAYAQYEAVRSEADRNYELAVAGPRAAFDDALASGGAGADEDAQVLDVTSGTPEEPSIPEPVVAGRGRRQAPAQDGEAGAEEGSDSPLF